MNKVNFEKIYNDTYSILFRYVVLKCDDISSVEDILQNVYFKLYKIIEKKGIDYIKFPIPLLIKMCKNELFKHYTLKHKISTLFYDDGIEYSLNNISSNENIEKNFIINSTIEEVFNIIKKEDLTTQKIATLYYLDDLSIKDIADLLNLNVNTTKTKLYRLINKIKEGGLE